MEEEHGASQAKMIKQKSISISLIILIIAVGFGFAALKEPKEIEMTDCINNITYFNATRYFTINVTDYALVDYNASCKTPIVDAKWCNNTFTYRLAQTEIVVKNDTECIRDGIVRVNEKEIKHPGRWCVLNKRYTNRIDCVTYGDGLNLANKESFDGCQKQGGMNCIIYIFTDVGKYEISSVNSEKYIRGVTKYENKTLGATI